MNKIILLTLCGVLLSLVVYSMIKSTYSINNYTHYQNKNFYKSIKPQNFALLLTMYNVENRKEMYMDIIKYYVDELNFPKNRLFIIDSSGNGIDETYVYNKNQLLYNQDDYKSYINNLTHAKGPSKYEILSLILLNKKFDFSQFNYVVKLTCKYKIPEIYTINDLTCNSVLLLQKNTDLDNIDIYQNTEILGIKGSEFAKVIDAIFKLSYNSNLSLEEIMMKLTKNISNCELPFLHNISNYKRNDKNVMTILSKPKIPKIIHKVLINDTNTFLMDNNVKEAQKSWINLNKEYILKLWNYSDCRLYLINNFPKKIIETFDNIVPYAYKCDFFRFCLIYKEGGWYSDWKEVCLKLNLLNNLEKEKVSIICFDDKNHSAKTSHQYIVNGFFGSSPNNPILRIAINTIIENVKNKYYGEDTLCPTGPGLLGKIINEYGIPTHGYFKNNYYYHKTLGKIIQHKCTHCTQTQEWKNGNNYPELWNRKQIYNQ
jgi:mannosyltransferase OCH1-like enzyme